MAGLFDAIGSTGFGITQQVFISDLTTLRNRGLWLSLPDSISAIPTLFLGTIVADAFLAHSTWRWGYGMWAIAIPVAALPLLMALFFWENKNRKMLPGAGNRPRILRDVQCDDPFLAKVYKLIWVELDLLGCLLLVAGLALILVPISLTGSGNSLAWRNAHFIAMLVIGFLLFLLFLIWDAIFAKRPFVPFRLVRHKTVVAACVLCILDFMQYSLFSVFFPSYLQAAGHYTAGNATRIEQGSSTSFSCLP